MASETLLHSEMLPMQDSYDPDEAYEDILLQLKEVIQQQVMKFKKMSNEGTLSANDTRTLLDLIGQVKKLAQEELEAAAQLPDDVLERIANRDRVRKHRAKKNDTVENSDQSTQSTKATERSK